MRYSADWMVLADERILEFIRGEGSGRPKAMADSGFVRYSREYINQRCKKLVEEGFLDHLGNGVYVITKQGKHYLDGEIDAQTLEHIDKIEESTEMDRRSGTEKVINGGSGIGKTEKLLLHAALYKLDQLETNDSDLTSSEVSNKNIQIEAEGLELLDQFLSEFSNKEDYSGTDNIASLNDGIPFESEELRSINQSLNKIYKEKHSSSEEISG